MEDNRDRKAEIKARSTVVAERNRIAFLTRLNVYLGACEARFDRPCFPVPSNAPPSPSQYMLKRCGGGGRPKKGGELLRLLPATVACGE